MPCISATVNRRAVKTTMTTDDDIVVEQRNHETNGEKKIVSKFEQSSVTDRTVELQNRLVCCFRQLPPVHGCVWATYISLGRMKQWQQQQQHIVSHRAAVFCSSKRVIPLRRCYCLYVNKVSYDRLHKSHTYMRDFNSASSIQWKHNNIFISEKLCFSFSIFFLRLRQSTIWMRQNASRNIECACIRLGDRMRNYKTTTKTALMTQELIENARKLVPVMVWG